MRAKGWNPACVLGIFALGVVVSAAAQDNTEAVSGATSQQKIGFINLDYIESQWVAYRVFKSDLIRLSKIDKQDIRQEQQDILRRQKTLEESQAQGHMSDKAFEHAHQLLLKQSQDVATYARVRAKIVKRRIDGKLDQASKYVEEVVQQIGEKEGYALILNDANLLSVDPAWDISQKVADVLNANTDKYSL